MNKGVIQRIDRDASYYRLRVAMDSRLEKPDQVQLTAPVLVELPFGLDVILPAGFVTDCHSIPLWLGSLLPEYDNRTNIAAIVHDYLYMHWEEFLEQNGDIALVIVQDSTRHRQFADRMYLKLMQRFHPGGWRNKLYYAGVRLFGWYNWANFRKAYKQSNP